MQIYFPFGRCVIVNTTFAPICPWVVCEAVTESSRRTAVTLDCCILMFSACQRGWITIVQEFDARALCAVPLLSSQPKEKTEARPKTLAQLRMQLKLEREAENQSDTGEGGETWTGAGPAAKSHLTELTRLMEGARSEAGKNFSQLLQKLDNIKQARRPFVCARVKTYT